MQSLEEAEFLDQRVILHHSLLDLNPFSPEFKIVSRVLILELKENQA